MLFNSYVFLLVFLPLTWIAFRFACRQRVLDVAIAVLCVASLVFYSYWNPPFVFLILFSVLFNYSWGRLIERKLGGGKSARRWLVSGVAVNLLLIAYFKYANFIMANIAWLGGWKWTAQEIFLPLGISFFTFQQVAYLIDCSRGKARDHAFTHYMLFVTFFPQLIAGPIVRYDQIMPQFSRMRTFGLSYRNIAMGLSLLTLGLFKKIVIADTLSPWVGAVFDTGETVPFVEAWTGALAYTFQIYFDFSGYSDMAIGLARLFNVELPLNFNSPYKAASIVDFWRRWHISLSTFLRDYLYIPLGGGREGKLKKHTNLLVTMLLGGLWHGASWTFVLWGGIHGLFLCINHGFHSLCEKRGFRIPRAVGWLVTFPAVVAAWVFFRAPTLSKAWDILRGMAGTNGFVLPQGGIPADFLNKALARLGVVFVPETDWGLAGREEEIPVLLVCFLIVLLLPNSYDWVVSRIGRKPAVRHAILLPLLLVVCVYLLNRASEFLYFQF